MKAVESFLDACKTNNVSVIILLKHKVPINCIDKDGNTGLMISCMYKHNNIVETFIKNELYNEESFTIKNKKGKTLLDIICEYGVSARLILSLPHYQKNLQKYYDLAWEAKDLVVLYKLHSLEEMSYRLEFRKLKFVTNSNINNIAFLDYQTDLRFIEFLLEYTDDCNKKHLEEIYLEQSNLLILNKETEKMKKYLKQINDLTNKIEDQANEVNKLNEQYEFYKFNKYDWNKYLILFNLNDQRKKLSELVESIIGVIIPAKKLIVKFENKLPISKELFQIFYDYELYDNELNDKTFKCIIEIFDYNIHKIQFKEDYVCNIPLFQTNQILDKYICRYCANVFDTDRINLDYDSACVQCYVSHFVNYGEKCTSRFAKYLTIFSKYDSSLKFSHKNEYYLCLHCKNIKIMTDEQKNGLAIGLICGCYEDYIVNCTSCDFNVIVQSGCLYTFCYCNKRVENFKTLSSFV